MEQIEIISKRKKREKHFLQKDGNIVAEIYNDDIHYYNEGKFEEIDNTLELKNGYYQNKSNDFKIYFSSVIDSEIMKLEQDGHYIKIGLNNYNDYKVEKSNSVSKYYDSIKYSNILKNIDLVYDVMPSGVKESIVLNNKECNIDDLLFNIDTDLSIVNENNSIVIKDNEKILFIFEKIYMVDSDGNKNSDIEYFINKNNNSYKIKFKVNSDWIKNEAKYPVIIDPTITQYSNENSVIDTYIYEGDTGITKSNYDSFKVGVERINNVDIKNRALLWFELPEIGTGNQIVSAILHLTSYPAFNGGSIYDTVDVHRVTENWMNSEPSWTGMNNKYDARVEGSFVCFRDYVFNNGTLMLNHTVSDITQLVQKWYTDKENYGIMLKLSEEVYNTDIIPMFFSKENSSSTYNPKPLLSITYKNQTGIQKYMSFETFTFSRGEMYHNTFNGNLVGKFSINSTKAGKLPINLELIYNTHDVVLNNNIGYGLGYRFNYSQTIEEEIIDNDNYLKYIDSTGTRHYFINKKTEIVNNNIVTNTYTDRFFDEDGMFAEIKKYEDKYELIDKNGNKSIFNIVDSIGYLKKAYDTDGSYVEVFYDNSNRITNIVDGNNREIVISYILNNIYVASQASVVELNYNSNNNLTSINDDSGNITAINNQDNLIIGIDDISGKKLNFEYYEQSPFKLKKVKEYGLNNSAGMSYQAKYGFYTTTLVDNINRTKTISFNNNGNPVSISNLKDYNDIENAYGTPIEYGVTDLGITKNTNKILSYGTPIRSVKNYIYNSSFENSSHGFSCSSGATIITSDYCSNTGLKSLKCDSSSNNSKLYKEFSDLEKGKYYTFSGYFKTGEENIKLYLSYEENNQIVKSEEIDINSADEFKRYDVTLFYPTTTNNPLKINIDIPVSTTFYLDDVQLEEGRIANDYNLIDNSDFADGIDSSWIKSSHNSNYNVNDIFDVVNVTQNKKALKMDMHTKNVVEISKQFNITGKQMDQYTLSFWYKNEGICNSETLFANTCSVNIRFNPVQEVQSDAEIFDLYLNPNESEWQFFSYTFTAPWDFINFTLKFMGQYNGNSLYLTDINLFKNIRNVKYFYDENGKVMLTKNKDLSEIEYKYDNHNNLVNISEGSNKFYTVEYDNVITDRLLQCVTEDGTITKIIYDNNNNVIRSIISDKQQMINPQDGLYAIRIKGTAKYVNICKNCLIVSEDDHNHFYWLLEESTIPNKYKIHHKIINNGYITFDNEVICDNYMNEKSLFVLERQDNGSFNIKNVNNNQYLKYDNNTISFSNKEDEEYKYQFFFEKISDNYIIEKNFEYTEDGSYLKSIVDPLFTKIEYEIDNTTGLVKSIQDLNNNIINYTYNSKRQLSSVSFGDKTINYSYNQQRQLSKISVDNIDYNFVYDDFLNLTEININNCYTLMNTTYENNNGRITRKTYGNGDYINYEYDQFNRLSKLIKNNEIIEYLFNNKGELTKIISPNLIIKYLYDLSNRLYELQYGNYIFNYNYDVNGNYVKKTIKSENFNRVIENTFEDNLLEQIDFDNDSISYEYDNLERIVSKSINNNFNTNYYYCNFGKRTNSKIKKISNNYESYENTYDKLGNIKKVYKNDVLQNEFYFNNYGQIIKENDYSLSHTIYYKYDNNENLLYKKICKLNTYDVISIDNFYYTNSNWHDLLTKVNNKIVTYDEIGNPLTIGSNISLSWVNGKQLSSYSDGSNTILYEYDPNGFRKSKTINNTRTEYILENSNVIIEKTGNNVIYYLRDNENQLVGFEYNGTRYFYLKNLFGDVTGIIDNNQNVVAKYYYDSYGNTLSITDGNDNDVSNNSNHIANINPYRYRSYYYDKETKLYYLNSRYYNPEWCRFINSDIEIRQDSLSQNLFIYCANDPVNNIDPNGNKGIFNAVVKIVKKVAKVTNIVNTIVNTAKKVVNNIVSTAKAIGKVANINFNYSYTRDVEIKGLVQNKSLPHVSIKNSDDYTIKLAGNDKNMFNINLNLDGLFSSGVSVSANTKYFNLEMKPGSLGVATTITLPTKNGTISSTLNDPNPMVLANVKLSSPEVNGYTNSTNYTVESGYLIPAAVFVLATVPAEVTSGIITACGSAATPIGKVADKLQPVISQGIKYIEQFGY